MAAGCPARESVYVYADTLQRTKATAQALLDGFAAGCGLTYRTKADGGLDSLFHPLEAGVCKLDPMIAQTRVLERTAGDLNRTTRDLKAPVRYAAIGARLLQARAVLGVRPRRALHAPRSSHGALCRNPTARDSADGRAGDRVDHVGIAAARIRRRQAGRRRGLGPRHAARRCCRRGGCTRSLRSHAAHALSRAQDGIGAAFACRGGRDERAAAWASAPPDPAVREAKFVAYVGHDTNIWNLAGMMDVTWLQPGWQRNQTPPGGALMFEVRESADKKLRVYTSYVAQSLEQMRNATPLTAETPPAKTPLRLPGMQHGGGGIPVYAGRVRDRDPQHARPRLRRMSTGGTAMAAETKWRLHGVRVVHARRARHQHRANARHESRGGDHACARGCGKALGRHGRDPPEGEDRRASPRRRRKRDLRGQRPRADAVGRSPRIHGRGRPRRFHLHRAVRAASGNQRVATTSRCRACSAAAARSPWSSTWTCPTSSPTRKRCIGSTTFTRSQSKTQ